jgi:putative membrane-bound dehydrogenase-like protein
MQRARHILISAFIALGPQGVFAQGFSPEEAVRKMSVPEGLEARLVGAEPLIRQPVAMEFDDWGRLWVIQYLQYPNPAGLKRVSVDRYSRTAYDRVPEPPPKGPRGADRITILEDSNGDGRADCAHDFATGLNLASGLAFGYGGVFVLQVPYLLFYPDRNHDDQPDGDPEVLLTGFGMEDAHSVANSLTWGPDGWLYGVQGSTVTAKIHGIEFQQGVWRYHPRTHSFELFCEGGGNMWGLDFDRSGQLLTSTNVGGFVTLHAVQGAYYWKSFGKHGPLHNPYTFGHFDHVRHESLKGGHVALGGLFYEADTLPEEWRGRYIAGDLLDHSVHAHELTPLGSTFRACQVVDVLRANDTWFAPSDLTLGPDGALYVADWHDRRTAHPDPDADWDRTNGRIFALTALQAKSGKRVDVPSKTDRELVALLDHRNTWYRRKARRLLAERRAAGVAGVLRQRAIEDRGAAALEALWALYGIAGLDENTAERLWSHPDADVRSWCVRLMGDQACVSSRAAAYLIKMASSEPDVRVRAQLACTARRLTAENGLRVAHTIAARDLDRDDSHIPLLVWWAVERFAMSDIAQTLDLFASAESWKSRMTREVVLERLLRRWSLARTAAGDDACAALLAKAPSTEAARPLLGALDESMRGRQAATVAPHLAREIIERWSHEPADVILTRLAARLGSASAFQHATAVACDHRESEHDRLAMLDLQGELGDRKSMAMLLDLVTRDGSDSAAIILSALSALGRFDDESIASAWVAAYPRQSEVWRSRVRELLLTRATWARTYLTAIARGDLPAKDLTLDQLGRFPVLQEPDLAALVRRHWGTSRGATREERLAEVRRLNNDLRAGPGDSERGCRLFHDRCAVCHRLDGEGETLGPDLTYANRKDRDFLLLSLVDPSGVVRKEYQTFQVATKDGRVLSGLIVEQTPEAITLRDAKGQRMQLARYEVAELRESDVSLMPESLYREFNPEQLRDLFSFLENGSPKDRKKRP